MGGKLPWELVKQLPEEYIAGWEIACSEMRSGQKFDWTLNRYGRYVGFGKAEEGIPGAREGFT